MREVTAEMMGPLKTLLNLLPEEFHEGMGQDATDAILQTQLEMTLIMDSEKFTRGVLHCLILKAAVLQTHLLGVPDEALLIPEYKGAGPKIINSIKASLESQLTELFKNEIPSKETEDVDRTTDAEGVSDSDVPQGEGS